MYIWCTHIDIIAFCKYLSLSQERQSNRKYIYISALHVYWRYVCEDFYISIQWLAVANIISLIVKFKWNISLALSLARSLARSALLTLTRSLCVSLSICLSTYLSIAYTTLIHKYICIYVYIFIFSECVAPLRPLCPSLFRTLLGYYLPFALAFIGQWIIFEFSCGHSYVNSEPAELDYCMHTSLQ